MIWKGHFRLNKVQVKIITCYKRFRFWSSDVPKKKRCRLCRRMKVLWLTMLNMYSCQDFNMTYKSTHIDQHLKSSNKFKKRLRFPDSPLCLRTNGKKMTETNKTAKHTKIGGENERERDRHNIIINASASWLIHLKSVEGSKTTFNFYNKPMNCTV